MVFPYNENCLTCRESDFCRSLGYERKSLCQIQNCLRRMEQDSALLQQERQTQQDKLDLTLYNLRYNQHSEIMLNNARQVYNNPQYTKTNLAEKIAVDVGVEGLIRLMPEGAEKNLCKGASAAKSVVSIFTDEHKGYHALSAAFKIGSIAYDIISKDAKK